MMNTDNFILSSSIATNTQLTAPEKLLLALFSKNEKLKPTTKIVVATFCVSMRQIIRYFEALVKKGYLKNQNGEYTSLIKQVSTVEDATVESKNITIVETIDYLNKKANRAYRYATYKRLLSARINEGFTKEDFFAVIDWAVKRDFFIKNPIYLRPSTLFAPSKFDGYINAAKKTSNAKTKDEALLAEAQLINYLKKRK